MEQQSFISRKVRSVIFLKMATVRPSAFHSSFDNVSLCPQGGYLLIPLILPSHCDLMITSWTVNHNVGQRSQHTFTHCTLRFIHTQLSDVILFKQPEHHANPPGCNSYLTR